jgi:hypothetical protein
MLRQPSQSSAYAAGGFNPVFKRIGDPPNSTFVRIGPGGEFWVRFAIRQNDAMLKTVYNRKGGGPKSNNGGTKKIIVHGHSPSGELEETVVDGWHRRVPQMYSNGGNEHYGVQDYIGCTENNTFNRDYNHPSNYPEPPCWKFKANRWQVFQVHVIAASASDPDNCRSLRRCTGIVELYVDDQPTPVIRVLNADHHTATGPPYSDTSLWDGVSDGYGQLTITFYATNKDPDQVHPEGIVWYDDIVVSRVRVPPLTGPGYTKGK